MIKRFLTTLYVLAPVAIGSIPALAAEADTGENAHYYPTSVEEYICGEQNEPRINRVYQLSLPNGPFDTPRSDSVWNRRLYYLPGMTRKDGVGVGTEPHTEATIRPSDTDNMKEILQRLEAELKVTTKERYTGMLHLDRTSAQVITDGYATETRSLSATRTYSSLSDADLALIPRSTGDNGKELTLADVQWNSSGQTNDVGGVITRYTTTASCTGAGNCQYVTSCTATANYTGEVAKAGYSVMTYTTIFDSMEIPERSTEPGPGSNTTSTDVDLSTLKLPLLIGGEVTVLVASGTFVFKKFKGQR